MKIRAVLLSALSFTCAFIAMADSGANSSQNRNVFAKVHGDFDKGPIPRFQAAATYPPSQEAKGVQGAAVVSFTIGVDGNVADVVVDNASDPAFGSAALAAAKRNKFRPASKGGVAVACKMDVLYTFPGPFVIGGSKH